MTDKQRQIIDYMRGNGGRLTNDGYAHMKRRWGVRRDTGMTRILLNLERQGIIEREGLQIVPTVLTEAGKNA